MSVDTTFASQPLQEWFNANRPADNLLWKNGLADQVTFVRDALDHVVRRLEYEERKEHPVMVVSTHRSKSVILPVYEITTPGFEEINLTTDRRHFAVRLRLRYNFFNWVVSVECKNHGGVRDYFKDLFEREARVQSVYAEGFRDEWVFGPYAEDRYKFTLNLSFEYDLWTFAWLLRAP